MEHLLNGIHLMVAGYHWASPSTSLDKKLFNSLQKILIN